MVSHAHRHEFDEDGKGISADGLVSVMKGMMTKGVIKMTSDGKILASKKAPQRHRGRTGIDFGTVGEITGHTGPLFRP